MGSTDPRRYGRVSLPAVRASQLWNQGLMIQSNQLEFGTLLNAMVPHLAGSPHETARAYLAESERIDIK